MAADPVNAFGRLLDPVYEPASTLSAMYTSVV